MFLVTLRMEVVAAKRMEFSQVMTSLVVSMRKAEGCLCCELYQDVEDGSEFRLFGEWDSRDALVSHLESEDFKVLLGAMHLLRKPHEMRLYEVVLTA